MLTLLKSCRHLRTFQKPTISRTMSFWDKEKDPKKMLTDPAITDIGSRDFDYVKRVIVDDFKAVVDRDLHIKRTLQREYDVVIVGAGAIGCSIAYWLKHRAPDSYSVAVIEKDSTYTKSTSALSLGGVRQQFSLPENIQMSMFGAEFLRNIERYLKIDNVDLPDIQFQPHGYLFLSTEAGAELMAENYKTQIELGAKVQLLTPRQLKDRFPWINTDGVALASHGIQNEGWFDPWNLIMALRYKAQSMGVDFLDAEVIGFDFCEPSELVGIPGFPDDRYRDVRQMRIRHPDNEVRQINFNKLVIACGWQSGEFGQLLGIGNGPAILQFPIPIEARKRFVYVARCKDGPTVDLPLVIDSTGAYIRREGLMDYYVMGMSPPEHAEPDVSNLDVDYEFFENEVWPIIANRVPAFNSLKLTSAWAGYYDYNHFDQNAIVGRHPWYPEVFMCTGFSGHGIQMAPAVGRAMMELICDHKFLNIDLSRFNFERIIHDRPIMENYIV